ARTRGGLQGPPERGGPGCQRAGSARALLEAAFRSRACPAGGPPPTAPTARAGARSRPPRHRRAPSLAPPRSPPREPEGMRRESATKLSLQPPRTGVPKALANPCPLAPQKETRLVRGYLPEPLPICIRRFRFCSRLSATVGRTVRKRCKAALRHCVRYVIAIRRFLADAARN